MHSCSCGGKNRDVRGFVTSIDHTTYTVELYRPRVIAAARMAVTERGLWAGCPKRADYSDLPSCAGALERHCGLTPGSVLWVSGDAATFDPPRDTDTPGFVERYQKIPAAVMYVTAIGDLKNFGFIGNAAITGPEQ